ncbi:erythromycin esterase family protein [Deinococcus radiotolerans]|uniref:Erythromycin esterase n=1 Tax=Deinococcus radiotolerans TaxID=1309407 RepID=A0ABQ2FHZ2_9DEIO|nr:erythromycin esterase family protein [Deinococcus radiotolerans]GGK98684.1 hypothetical protein GCM10010844_16130 [Deinococcus radiotolerans]
MLIGEASHGTEEFYRWRAQLTQRLIEQGGVAAVAVEADWPDAYRVNRFVRGQGDDRSAREALGDFQRFPRWMWRNTAVEAFVTWLRAHNARHPQAQTGLYGLDLYSLHRSMHAVVAYLEETDPAAAARARDRYGCFELFGPDPQACGYVTGLGAAEPCEQQAAQQLVELQGRGLDGDLLAEDEHFYAEQNARLARNAERYYRAMFRGRESWNIRDQHMAETLEALDGHLGGARTVVWAHNSHLGDARGSAMGIQHGELNLGQLTRERWPRETFIVGQTTYAGTVFAAHDWDQPGQVRVVRPALPGSLEAQVQAAGLPACWLDLRGAAWPEQLQRFIGVVYRPDTERHSHYLTTRPAEMYDALVHFAQTRALTPLDDGAGAVPDGELPDTAPSGL